MTYSDNRMKIPKSVSGIIQKEQIIPFKNRLAMIIGDESIRGFSERCSVSDTTLRDYLRGKSFPTLDRLCSIATAANVDLAWLATGVYPQTKEVVAKESINTNMIKVPQFDLKASAGCGCLVISEEPIAEFSFSKEWLIKNNLYGSQLTVVPVHGDSMEPTLMDEDLMLIKMVEHPTQAREGICVIRIDDDVFVKRIQFDYEQQGYHIFSDNIAYKPFFIGSEFQGRFDVLGRLVRVLQKPKQAI